MEVGTENLAMTPDVMSSDKAAILEEFERRKKVKAINVSTSDSEVEEDRRKLREPICLFGEGPADRRSRLRELLGRLGEDDVKRRRIMDDMRADEDNEVRSEDTTWYHEGPDSLRVAREWIAQYSIPRDKERLKHLKAESELPTARMELDNSVPCLASCSSDGSVKLWSLDSEEPMADIESHDVRVSWCVYRPSGRFLATAAHTNLVSNVKFEKTKDDFLISSSYDNRPGCPWELCRVTTTNCPAATSRLTGKLSQPAPLTELSSSGTIRADHSPVISRVAFYKNPPFVSEPQGWPTG